MTLCYDGVVYPLTHFPGPILRIDPGYTTIWAVQPPAGVKNSPKWWKKAGWADPPILDLAKGEQLPSNADVAFFGVGRLRCEAGEPNAGGTNKQQRRAASRADTSPASAARKISSGGARLN